MKKHVFWFQITMSSFWIIGAILLMVFWFFASEETIKVCGDWILIIALILAVNGVWKISEIFHTQKELQKHFKKNEEDKKEIEKFKKNY